MNRVKAQIEIEKHRGGMSNSITVSNKVSQQRKLWKEWQWENASKGKYLEAKKKARWAVYSRPTVKQNGIDMKTLWGEMITNVMCLRL